MTSQTQWQKKSFRAMEEARLNLRIADRLKELEDDLRQRGIHIVCGVEQEFFAFEKDHRDQKQQWPEEIDVFRLQNTLADFPHLQNLYVDNHQMKVLEVVLGAKNRTSSSKPVYATAPLAEEVLQLRHSLGRRVAMIYRDMGVSFEATQPYAKEATAGLHVSISAADARGENLFCTPQGQRMAFTPLAERCANRLLQLHQEGLALYVPDEASYQRYGRNKSAPSALQIASSRSGNSIARRKTQQKMEECRDYYRIEDVLAPASANPYIPLLATLGALHYEVTHYVEQTAPKQQEEIPGDIQSMRTMAQERLSGSALWREIAGESLYNDLVAYARERTGHDSGRSSF